jgi:hypothetical protein
LRDPINLNTLYASNPGYSYAWSEIQAWEFDTELMDAWVMEDILYANCKSGIKRITDNWENLNVGSVQETGLVKHSVSPQASGKAEALRHYVSFDQAYLFNGSMHREISKAVENYFNAENYYNEQAIAHYSKKHLFICVVPRTGSRALLDCYLPELKWRLSDYLVNCFCVWDGPNDKGELFYGDQSGNIYKLQTGYASGEAVKTKNWPIAKTPFYEATVHGIDVIAKSADSSGGQVQIQFVVDGTLNTSFTESFPASGDLPNVLTLYKRKIIGVQPIIKGSKVGLSITHSADTKHFAIEAIRLWGEIAPLERKFEE